MLPFSCPPEYRKRTLRLLRSLCVSWGVLPTSYTFQGEVKDLGENPFASSNTAEVFQGTSGGEMVAVKSRRIYRSDGPGKLNKVDIC